MCLFCLFLGDRLTILEVAIELHRCLVIHVEPYPSWATDEVCASFDNLQHSLLPFGIEPLHLAALLYELGGDRSPDIHYEPCVKLKKLSRLWAVKLNNPPLNDFRKLLDVPLPGKTAPS